MANEYYDDREYDRRYDERWRSRPRQVDYDREGYSATAYNRDYGREREPYGEPFSPTNYGGDDWRKSGPYTGIGPRGYRRSDERIFEEVCERLAHHGQLDARAINVRIQNGEILLQGIVNSRRDKRLAEDIAESVPGVVDVHNQLRLSEAGVNQPSPAEPAERWEDRVREGMQVVGSDEENIGRVKEVRHTDFLVDRTLARDIYVPYEAVQSASQDRVIITVPAGEVNDQGWANPELTETPT